MRFLTNLALPALALLAVLSLGGCPSDDDSPSPDAGTGSMQGGGKKTYDARPAAHCSGVPSSCALQTTAYTCGRIHGCTATDQECTGFAKSCYSLYDASSCYGQDGCYWSSGSSYCSGSATSCSSEPGQFSCGSQAGCTWRPLDCAGVPYTCSTFSTEYTCLDQPGCTWGE